MKQVAFLFCCLAVPAAADLLYDNTNLTQAVSGIGPLTQCGPGGCMQGISIYFDDVLVPLARDPTGAPLAIQQVTVGVGGPPGLNSFGLWTIPVLPNGSPALPPQQVAVANVMIGPSGTQNLTFGNGAATIFTVQPDFTADPGYGLFYIGLNSSTVGAGWLWANGPDFNLPTAYFYNGPANQLFLNTSPPGFPSNLSFAVQIQGVVVPELSSVALLATLLPILVCRSMTARSKRKALTRA